MKLTNVYKVIESVKPAKLGDELAMLNVENGEYYVINEIGKNIWELLDGKRDINLIVESLLLEYEIDEASCISQTLIFLEALLYDSLIYIVE